MSQDGQACVEALVTTGRARTTTSTPYWDKGLPAVGRVPFDDCVRLMPATPGREPGGHPRPDRGPAGAGVERIHHRDAERDAGSCGAGWPSPATSRSTRSSLLFAVDAYPPATFEIEFSGWVPTLELTVYVRALPAPGPVRVLQRAQLIDGQRVDESCFDLGPDRVAWWPTAPNWPGSASADRAWSGSGDARRGPPTFAGSSGAT